MKQFSHSATRGEICICFASYRFRLKIKFCSTVEFSLKTPEDLDFWVVAPSGRVIHSKRFEGMYCVHLQEIVYSSMIF
jgi:hypothetical protein